MSAILVIVAVVAVIVIAAVVVSVWRKTGLAEAPERPVVAAPPAQPAPSEPEPIEVEKGSADQMAPEPEAAVAMEEPAGEEIERPEAEARSGESEDLRSRVEAQLADSERMLHELRQAVLHAEGMAQQQVVPDTLDIMAEGLEEVRALAKDSDWSQAKDKSRALHAQLSLLLQTARREQAS